MPSPAEVGASRRPEAGAAPAEMVIDGRGLAARAFSRGAEPPSEN